MPIHPTAVIDPRAEVHPTADIGPYVVLDGPVRIGARTRLMAHGYFSGRTSVGDDNLFYPGVQIGHEPMDLAYDRSPTEVRIGNGNVFREHAEVHRGTRPDTATVIGDGNYFMSRSHVAHNCTIGDRVIVCSGALIAGHAIVEDQAFVSGNCVVHQYTRIGRLAILRGLSRTSRDVPPFCIMDGTHTVRGLNRVGLRRAGFDAARVRALANAFRVLFRIRTNLRQAVAVVEAGPRTADVDYLLDFIRAAKRGVAMGPPRHGVAGAADADDE